MATLEKITNCKLGIIASYNEIKTVSNFAVESLILLKLIPHQLLSQFKRAFLAESKMLQTFWNFRSIVNKKLRLN